MKSLILYGAAILLGIALLWFIWVQLMTISEPASAPASEPVQNATSSTPATTSASTARVTATTSTQATSSTSTEVRIEGVFLSLQEMETQWRTAHTYLLLDDGTEIFRVDLRPLLGNTVREVTTKLGIERGDRIEVLGRMSDDNTFTIQAINPVSPN